MTDTLKCSEGPWSVEGREIADCIGRRIAVVSGDPRNPRAAPVMQANAAMMGAALAMYEALKPFAHGVGREYDQARAALAQARGEARP